MFQAFVVVLREGFESFLIVGIILAYLRRIQQEQLIPAVYWGVAASLVASAALGYMLNTGVNGALWEGVFGVVTIVLVGTLVVHMWRAGAKMKHEVESKLSRIAERSSGLAFAGVFFFTLVMIAREGMEVVLMLFQIRQANLIAGVVLGIIGAVAISWAWVRFGRLINMKRFFQVTAIFLLLFMVQIAIYSFHEFTESGLFANSEFWHEATEPYSPTGIYGSWFTIIAVGACAVWLIGAYVNDSRKRAGRPDHIAVR
jgi:high-affinity iron transporter